MHALHLLPEPPSSHADAHPTTSRRLYNTLLPALTSHLSLAPASASAFLTPCPNLDIHPRRTITPQARTPASRLHAATSTLSLPLPFRALALHILAPCSSLLWSESPVLLPGPCRSRPPWELQFLLLSFLPEPVSLARVPSSFAAPSTPWEPAVQLSLHPTQPTAPSWAANRASTHGVQPPATILPLVSFLAILVCQALRDVVRNGKISGLERRALALTALVVYHAGGFGNHQESSEPSRGNSAPSSLHIRCLVFWLKTNPTTSRRPGYTVASAPPSCFSY